MESAQINACLNIMRRLPPAKIPMSVAGIDLFMLRFTRFGTND